MKYFLTFFLSALLFSCSSDNDESIKEVSVKLKFSQNWDGTVIEKSDLENTEFTNKTGSKLSISRLRYLISRISLVNGAGDTTKFDSYKLIDVSKPDSLTYALSKKVSEGSYKLLFTFGFNNDDNKDGEYPDLNSVSWNADSVGGYHYMQLDGKYKDTLGVENSYNFHAVRAYDKEKDSILDTSFGVETGSILLKSNATIEIKMNVAGWFKSPNDWDLNDKSINLMPDFEAQKEISENGKSGVFSLGAISQ
ncbi:MbnP family protein [Tenacibaculum sp. Ill]|uniref:MbnP family protein n=1 Tax=Tenacibaculum sp. Ill TaxID=3445935 RepID=UPI003F7A1F18